MAAISMYKMDILLLQLPCLHSFVVYSNDVQFRVLLFDPNLPQSNLVTGGQLFYDMLHENLL